MLKKCAALGASICLHEPQLATSGVLRDGNMKTSVPHNTQYRSQPMSLLWLALMQCFRGIQQLACMVVLVHD